MSGVNGTIALTYRWAKRIAIGLVGGTVLLIGIVMVVLPGPAFVVIPLGLAILGVEFAWARRWLRHVRERAQQWMPSRKNGKDAPGVAKPGMESGADAPSDPAHSAPPPATPPPPQRSTASTAARKSS